MFDWSQFVSTLSHHMGRKGWPNRFLVTPETAEVIYAQTDGKGLSHTHILGIPFEECPSAQMGRRAAFLKQRGKIVWAIDVRERYEPDRATDGEMGRSAEGESQAG